MWTLSLPCVPPLRVPHLIVVYCWFLQLSNSNCSLCTLARWAFHRGFAMLHLWAYCRPPQPKVLLILKATGSFQVPIYLFAVNKRGLSVDTDKNSCSHVFLVVHLFTILVHCSYLEKYRYLSGFNISIFLVFFQRVLAHHLTLSWKLLPTRAVIKLKRMVGDWWWVDYIYSIWPCPRFYIVPTFQRQYACHHLLSSVSGWPSNLPIQSVLHLLSPQVETLGNLVANAFLHLFPKKLLLSQFIAHTDLLPENCTEVHTDYTQMIFVS